MENRKPAIGARPFYIAASDRIAELAEAIHRVACDDGEWSRMEFWATEIVHQCRMAKGLEKERTKIHECV